MGARGPLPQQDNVRFLKGNPGKRTSPATVKAKPAIPAPPTWIDREAKAEWQRITGELNELGLIARIDRAVLTLHCRTWSMWVRADRQLADEDLVVLGEKDMRKNPLWQVWREAGAQCLTLCKELGCAPGARLRMSLPEGEDGDEGDGILD